MINVNEVHPDKDYQGMPENMFTNLENPKIQVFSIEPSFVSIYIYICVYIYSNAWKINDLLNMILASDLHGNYPSTALFEVGEFLWILVICRHA